MSDSKIVIVVFRWLYNKLRRPHHLCHLKCNKSLTHKHFVFDVTWSVEQNRGTNILGMDTGAVLQVLVIKLNVEHF